MLARTRHTEGDGLHSAQAERACLGAALEDNGLLHGPLGVLAVNDFFLSAHREIFGLILQADAEGLPIDTLTLVESLRQEGRLEAAGGFAYIGSLTDGVVTHTGLITRHAETVKRFSVLRQVQKIADRTARIDSPCRRASLLRMAS